MVRRPLITRLHELRAAAHRGLRRITHRSSALLATDTDSPLRAELFSAEQMEQHGRSLALTHRTQTQRGRDPLLPRLGANQDVLEHTCDQLMQAVKNGQRITPAGEWLLDNFYLIDEQIRTARVHFPKGYSRELPLLAGGVSTGFPRVYDIALEVISHGDGRVDPENLTRFVSAYQTVSALKLGELWAIPIMLRLALIENLRRISARVAASMVERHRAGHWADQMIEVAQQDPKSLILVISDMARSSPPLVNSFVAELARRLQGHSLALALPLTWIEQRLGESGSTIEQMVHSETQSQAVNQVCISNTIGSLRLLGALDWREFVESMSVVDHTLRNDPSGVYSQMDFATRDHYRHKVEQIARRSRFSEDEVAQKAVALAGLVAGSALEPRQQKRQTHVGYYLIDKGQQQLESVCQTTPTFGQSVRACGRHYRLQAYLGAIALLTLGFSTFILQWALLPGTAFTSLQGITVLAAVLLAMATALCASQLALTLVNWFATLLVTPHSLPRMDYSTGIAPEARTLVVVPTMLNSLAGIDKLVDAMEVRFLANRDPCLQFGLLTDFRDAQDEHLPTDAALVAYAVAKVETLNTKYAQLQTSAFFLFHRPRRWNAAEKIWMGYERKRGKLGDLNALLRGAGPDAFSAIVGDISGLQTVQFVITLDTDTQLQRDAARLFAATLAHPLNRPHFDSTLQRVTEGYGILQPRMAISLTSTQRSRYARLCSDQPGVDPYTRAVSDVYQDLFQEGSFIGKGIYDVDAFEQALKGRFPENRILSHDLLEGCYARSGLVSDAQLYDDYPGRYDEDVSRRKRWIRGDWQIASWLLSRAPGPTRVGVRSQLSALSQWKILDNLRRSLVPAGLCGLFLFGWLAVPAYAAWTVTLVALLFLAPLLTTAFGLLHRPAEVPLSRHIAQSAHPAVQRLTQTLLHLAFLPHEAFYSLDAVLRTTFRILISQRLLLEWAPSGEQRRKTDGSVIQAPDPGSTKDLVETLRAMWIAPAWSFTVALLLTHRPMAFLVAAPLLMLWFVAPLLAWWFSRPLLPYRETLNPEQRNFLRLLARKTWRFFDQFVVEQDHWLPPDNFQEHPAVAVAHRTSPTNMGIALLANLAAHDFGYISTAALLTRTANALQTMLRLERYRGHFYNWYDTLTLKTLAPRYVSSVDSGNLSGHLLTLRPGLLALADHTILNAKVLDGLADAIGQAIQHLDNSCAEEVQRAATTLMASIDAAVTAGEPANLEAARQLMVQLRAACEHLNGLIESAPASALAYWTQAALKQCNDHLVDLVAILPTERLPRLPDWMLALPVFAALPTWRQLSGLDTDLRAALAQLPCDTNGQAGTQAERDLMAHVIQVFRPGILLARSRMLQSEALATQAAALARAEYAFLYDPARHLIAVGYNVDEQRCDTGYYDLLASEARLCSFVAIAQAEIPQENWFALGRLLTSAGGEPILLSWSGSMFEYLMPMLVMPNYANTLLDQTCVAVVKRQIEYAGSRSVPWGISESGYNTVDTALNYQYRAFGVPGLGLKRGLSSDLVVAPYASALALMVLPDAACKNLQALEANGLMGDFGLYEAVDFTTSRLPRGQSSAVIRSFMPHHQGMSLLSLVSVLMDQPMQRRFATDPLFQATTLLLQERIPHAAVVHIRTPDVTDARTVSGPEMPMRVLHKVDTLIPEVQLLSNGRYHVMISQSGGGYSRWKDQSVTRWREDATRDHWGAFCFVRDTASGEFWSTAYQPTLKKADAYEAIFSEGRAEFRRRDHSIETHTEVVVSPELDMEMRRVRLTNRSRARRTIEITSYAEVVLAPAAADALHPAFSNLFVQTEVLPERNAILCCRRPRSVGEPMPWMFHLMTVHGAKCSETSYETDRMRFIGRNRSIAAPIAMVEPGHLSGSEGSVLDPVVAIRTLITLEPQQTATIDMVFGMGDTRDAALTVIGKYHDRHLADRVFDLAWTHSWVNLQQINATESDAQLFGSLASSVIYANPAQRADGGILARNRRAQSGLWGYGVSGDLPIVLLQIINQANIALVRQLVQAHAYWRLKGLAVDLVIWNEDHAGYRQALQDQILGLIAAGVEANFTDRPGGIFVRAAEQMSNEDRTLFQSVARVIITDTRGSLADQINRRLPRTQQEMPPAHVSSRPSVPRIRRSDGALALRQPPPDLLCFNGQGGFSADGREYVILTNEHLKTPAPWVNVIANPRFGTVISESGAAYTWSENAHEFRYSAWENDPVGDAGGEAIYIRDEESGAFWSPTPSPCGPHSGCVTRHGFGYSTFEQEEDGIHSLLTVFVDLDAAIKFSMLKLTNRCGRARRLSVTGYVEWVLGDLRHKTAMHVTTEIDLNTGAILAHNAYSPEFGDRVAFFDADGATRQQQVTYTGDRREFLGRNGSLKDPAAMHRTRLSNRVGAGLDPCAAVQVPLDLAEGQARDVVFRLSATGRRGVDDAGALVQHLREPQAVHGSLAAVHAHWRHVLGAVQVQTPIPELNLLANGWLIYQTIACRLWARSGFYQSGGAFGFRDQLQDTMALVHTEPMLLREHVLRCAARQFVEGDVQHWWHPPQGRGVRTQCSDDYLWLVQATCRYVEATGDTTVLQETVGFLEGRPVNREDDSYYDLPVQSPTSATLYEHCLRALRHGASTGSHGLPLIGSGDWNDGMNLVGIEGRGESVWLAFFRYDTLMKFRSLAQDHGDAAIAAECTASALALQLAIEAQAWDGGWYRRAYFDDGTPLGSLSNTECQIDSVSQSWSVLSGAGEPARARIAMLAVEQRLVNREAGLIQLLDPPFGTGGVAGTTEMNPGYIKGYLPGVRENGGQYTHAAIWTAMAFAAQGDRQRAWECFDLINPLNHGNSPAKAARYKVEPYVVAADVYAQPPHEGRGGWTWYTGSASWMYRLILESLLGVKLQCDRLTFHPCVPREWAGFSISYRYRTSTYNIVCTANAEPSPPTSMNAAPGAERPMQVVLDDVLQVGPWLQLADGAQTHKVRVVYPV